MELNQAPKCHQNESKLRPSWSQCGTKLGRHWNQSGTKLIPIWGQTGTKLEQNWDQTGTKLGPIWGQTGPKLEQNWDQTGDQTGAQNGSKMGPEGDQDGTPGDPHGIRHRSGTGSPKSVKSVELSSKTGGSTFAPAASGTRFWDPLRDSLK